MLFVKSSMAKRLAMSKSALDDLMADARRPNANFPPTIKRLQEYLTGDTEIKIEKAKRWLDTLPQVDHLKLDIVSEDPRIICRQCTS